MVDNIDMDCLGPRGCQEVADGAVDRAGMQGLGCLRMRTGGRSHRGRQRGWEGRGGRPRAGAGSPPLPCATESKNLNSKTPSRLLGRFMSQDGRTGNIVVMVT